MLIILLGWNHVHKNNYPVELDINLIQYELFKLFPVAMYIRQEILPPFNIQAADVTFKSSMELS